MSTNFNPQPHLTGPSSSLIFNPKVPVPNREGSYLATASKQYYSGAVRFGPGVSITDKLIFVPVELPPGISPNAALNDVFYASPLCKCGVVSFWAQYAPSTDTQAGWPLIGQDGNVNLSVYFGTDPAHPEVGSIEVQLIPMPVVDAVEFSSGVT
jgi:hypothetical protein